MVLIQEAFELSTRDYSKLLTGEYIRTGGIIRKGFGSQKGQIVKHLKPITVNSSSTSQIVHRIQEAGKFVTKNKKGLLGIGLGVGMVAGTGAYFSYKKMNNKRKSERYIEDNNKENINQTVNITNDTIDVKNINKTSELERIIGEYILSVGKGELTAEILDAFIDVLNKYEIEDSIRQSDSNKLDEFVNNLFAYTKKLAKDNNIKLSREELTEPMNGQNKIGDINRYIHAQKKIFQLAS